MSLGEICAGCGKEWINIFQDGGVCMDCVKARHRAVVNGGRCSCGRKAKPGKVSGPVFKVNGRDIGRKFIPCGRCLGVIKQIA